MVKGQGLAVLGTACIGVALFGTPFITTAFAGTTYWDTNSSVAGQGSATTPVNWLTNSWTATDGGLMVTGAWANNTSTNADLAYFKGTGGTVNLAADVFVNALRFETSTYAVTGTNYLHLTGASPNMNVQLTGSGQNEIVISAPITGSTGLNIDGSAGAGVGFKFITFANTNTATQPNNYTGPLTINAGGAVRLGGGAANEQIPDSSDLILNGAIDYITAGSASLDKQEKVRNVTVNTTGLFSVGNGALFVVNALAGSDAANISCNGNSTIGSSPARLWISGWNDGHGDLTLNGAVVKLSTTSGTNIIGSVVTLSGNIVSSGTSEIRNQNGNAASANTNTVTYKAFVFDQASHDINVTGGTLSFTSIATNAAGALQIQSTFAGGTTLNKTGPGTLVFANAVQTGFTGTTNVAQGILQIGLAERLADASNLKVSGGTFDMQTFAETVNVATLAGGSITGSGILTATGGFAVQSGSSAAPFAGAAGLTKTTGGLVTLTGANTYAGSTIIQAGTLKLGASAHSNAINSAGFTDIQSGALVFDTPTAPNKTSILSKLDTAAAGAFLTGQFRSSTANALRGLGYTDDGTLFTIAPTYFGDTNLDQLVNVTDLLAISQFYLQTTNTTWSRGDFNYSHTITLADLQQLVANYAGNILTDKQTVFATNPSQQFITDLNALTVPEPTSIAWVAGAAMIARRRTRR